MPMERRLTPAVWNLARLKTSADAGLASNVTSVSSAKYVCWESVSKTAAIVDGLARLGVPPPKNTDVILQHQQETEMRTPETSSERCVHLLCLS